MHIYFIFYIYNITFSLSYVSMYHGHWERTSVKPGPINVFYRGINRTEILKISLTFQKLTHKGYIFDKQQIYRKLVALQRRAKPEENVPL